MFPVLITPSTLTRAFGTTALLLLGLAASALPAAATTPVSGQNNAFVGEYNPETESFLWVHEASGLIGAHALYNRGYWGMGTTIANVESGFAQREHEVFAQRIEGIPISLGPGMTYYYSPPTFNENSSIPNDPLSAPGAALVDGHATAVASMIGGLMLNDEGEILIFGTGIAPLVGLQSGAIATHYSETNPGSFSTSEEAFLKPYRDYFLGTGGVTKADVINNSYGFFDPDARTQVFGRHIDGLAYGSADVAMVVASGNSGEATAPSSPASSFNVISVGGLTHDGVHTERFLTPWAGTVGQALDFTNPQTGETTPAVRAGVHIAAPSTNMALAYSTREEPETTDLYIINASGTSFAAPMVAGGIALLKEMVRRELAGNTDALDTRVVRSVIMAGATRTVGWDNAQSDAGDGVIRTTQALDLGTGAGLLNLTRSATIYLNPHEPQEGPLSHHGWDLNTIATGQEIDYLLTPFSSPFELTLSLNWFSATEFNETTAQSTDLWLSNLNLSLWDLGGTPTLLAESISLYNTSEFLRLTLDGGGQYAIRVSHLGMIFDTTENALGYETYALAWSTTVIPEPSSWLLIVAGATGLLLLRRRRQAA